MPGGVKGRGYNRIYRDHLRSAERRGYGDLVEHRRLTFANLARWQYTLRKGCNHDREEIRLVRRQARASLVPLARGGTLVSGVDDDRARVVALIAQQPAAPRDRGVVVGSLGRLCAAAAKALSASGAAVAVMAEDGVRGVTVASDPASERPLGEVAADIVARRLRFDPD